MTAVLVGCGFLLLWAYLFAGFAFAENARARMDGAYKRYREREREEEAGLVQLYIAGRSFVAMTDTDGLAAVPTGLLNRATPPSA